MNTGRVTIELCVNNLTMDMWTTLHNHDAEFDQNHCLGRCGVCHQTEFFVWDGELITAAGHGHLLSLLDSEG